MKPNSDNIFNRNTKPTWEFEQKSWTNRMTVAGVDEAGRGPLAGPVVAAAVMFREPCELPGLRDSKKLSAKKREELFDLIRTKASCYGVAACSENVIDRIGILQATHTAMKRALAQLPVIPDEVLVDGRPAKIDRKHIALIKGDDRSFSIAAASVLAKVLRDRMMLTYHQMYPEYEFNLHKGYPTPRHKELLRIHEPCPIHRMTFSGVQYDLFP